MPTTQTNADELLDRANRLYWNSDRTVDDIVADLGIRRGALYAAIEPMRAGMKCPECGDAMVFANRTSRDAGRAVCATCGVRADAPAREGEEIPLENSHDEWRPAGRFLPIEPGIGRVWSRWREDLAGVEPQRAALVGGAAALGVVLGAAAARAVREML